MRLADTKRTKYKPKEHQKAFMVQKGRPRTKMKEFSREAVFALRVRSKLVGDVAWSKWRWYSWTGHHVDEWWTRALFPKKKAEDTAAYFRTLGSEVKIITVWRKPS